ncbi:amidohydrolase [Flammeovirgaceae bacterium 311]|nr:amidohydrolase [Flammeovirgaceae bacterium 311]
MTLQNRRQFLKKAGPLGLMPLVPALSFRDFFRTSPDLILYNANIITVNPDQPQAEALAVIGDRIVAVGSNREIRRLAGARTRKVDIGGKVVTPGFIDAHAHPLTAGKGHLRSLDADLRSIKAIQELIREKAAKTPPGHMISAFKYDDTKTTDGRKLNRYDLDAAAPNHLVQVWHRGGHSVYVNSRALELMGYTRDTPDPEGGKIIKDPETGLPTGELLETAYAPMDKLDPNPTPPGKEDDQEAVKLISQLMNRAGITSVTEAYGSPQSLITYQDAQKAGKLSLRIYSLIGTSRVDKMIDAGMRTGFGDEWVRIGGMKITCDGSISERTARLSEPYIGRPDDYGIIRNDEEDLYENSIRAHKADWQIAIHANGDVAVDKALSVFERLQAEYPRKDPRFRIEHCTVVNNDLIRRMKALNVIPNPFSTYVYFHGEKMKEYGAKRVENMFAVRSFLDAGLKPTQTSDYVPGPFEPMMAIQSSVTRTDIHGDVWGPSQKITVEEAIKVGTIHGAYASYEEDIKGSLEVGKLSDLVVLGADPRKVDPFDIINIPIERTMVGGKWVYES